MKKFKVVFKEIRDDLEIEADGYHYCEDFVNFFLECDKRECCENETKLTTQETICAVSIDNILSIHTGK